MECKFVYTMKRIMTALIYQRFKLKEAFLIYLKRFFVLLNTNLFRRSGTDFFLYKSLEYDILYDNLYDIISNRIILSFFYKYYILLYDAGYYSNIGLIRPLIKLKICIIEVYF